jgi:hypothetical protein
MNPEQLKPEYERVFTVTEYYDGPRKGIASFLGVPHLYECLFDEEKDGFSDQFLLTPIDTETFQLAMEDWSIWQRWEVAFKTGKSGYEYTSGASARSYEAREPQTDSGQNSADESRKGRN